MSRSCGGVTVPFTQPRAVTSGGDVDLGLGNVARQTEKEHLDSYDLAGAILVDDNSWTAMDGADSYLRFGLVQFADFTGGHAADHRIREH
jgi:hypothetical protein